MHTHKEALEVLNCTKMTLSRYVKNGRVQRIKKGRKAYYYKREIALIAKEIDDKKRLHRPDLPEKPREKIELPPDLKETIKNIDVLDVLDEVGFKILFDATKALKNFGLYNECDREVLTQYAVSCQMLQRYMFLANECDSIVVSDTGIVSLHPHHRVMMDYQKMMLQYSDRLGLNPLARTKFEIKADKEPSEMQKLLIQSN